MPIYEYKCDMCGRKADRLQAWTAMRPFPCDPTADGDDASYANRFCPGKMRPQISRPAPPQGDFGTPKKQR